MRRGYISEFSRKLIIIVNFSTARRGGAAFARVSRLSSSPADLYVSNAARDAIITAFTNEVLRAERVGDTMRVGNHPG